MFDNFLSLIFPKLCVCCGRGLQLKEECICTICHYKLPETNYHLHQNNPVYKLFWGRININAGASYYRLSNVGMVRNLIRGLKYDGHGDIGFITGKFYGARLKESKLFSSVDLIIPVPIHENKLRKRGYNQSECFANGISKSMGTPVNNKAIKRVIDSETQTNKSRFERWENVRFAFKLTENNDVLAKKHVLLVDDIVTTGATLEACAETLLNIPEITVSVATLCFSEM